MNQTIGANKAFYLSFAVSALLLFLVFSLLTKVVPLTVSHILYSCKEAMAGISISLPHSFPSVFVLMLFFVVLIGLSLLTFQIYKTRLFIGRILKNKVTTPKRIKDIASEFGISKQVDIVSGNTHSSFCYGLILPRICLSLNLVNSLTNGELKAVLIHESYHLKNRDPLKVLLSQVAVSMFFFVPVLRDFHRYFILSKELAADQLVIRTKLMKDLKTALTKSLGNLTPNLSGIATFASENNLEQRVSVLTAPHFKTSINISLVKMLISALVLISAFGVLNLPVHAMENADGTHSYFIMSPGDTHMVSCIKENVTTEYPFSSEGSYSPMNYSPNH